MLDMAFQLLAFFVLTFQTPSSETYLDLDLPATPVSLPGESRGKAQPRAARRVDADLENDLWLRVEANDLGDLKSIRLGEASIPDLETLGERIAAQREPVRRERLPHPGRAARRGKDAAPLFCLPARGRVP